jgi:hypothetical protein
MKLILAWLLLIQMTLSKSLADSIDTASLEPRQGETSTSKTTITPKHPDGATYETGDASISSTAVEARQRDEAAAISYTIHVTDENNQGQINETLKWLEGLVKDKSKMTERRFFPEDIPDDENENYEKLAGWKHCLLDQAGYEEVKGKTEWIAGVYDPSQYLDVESRAISDNMKKPKALRAKKVEWGDWDKQDAAAKNLVQASQWK